MASRTVRSPGVTVAIALALTSCASVPVDPRIHDVKSVALVSVHARAHITFDAPLNGRAGITMAMTDNELGTEVVEMMLGDAEGEVGQLLRAETVVPPDEVMRTRVSHDLPEATPPEAWSQVKEMVAVDVSHPRTAEALGRVAQALGVDAAVVLRHEWSVTRDRLELGGGITAVDRCAVLVVDAQGRTLFDDVTLARVPAAGLGFDAQLPGINGASFADEARVLARLTARQCMAHHKRRLDEARAQRERPKG